MKRYQIWARAKDQNSLLRKAARIFGYNTGWNKLGKPLLIADIGPFLDVHRQQFPALEILASVVDDCPNKLEPTSVDYMPNDKLDRALRDWFGQTDWNAELDKLVEEEGGKK